MTKTIMILAIATAIVVGSIATGTIALADDDDEVSSLLCDAGKVMTGIVFGDDDDSPTQIFCAELLEGPQGPQGDPGVLNFYHIFGTVETVQPGAFVALTASCLSGDHLTGGGHQVTIGIGAPQVRISAPLTASPSDTWEVQLFNPNAADTQNIRAVVICADLP